MRQGHQWIACALSLLMLGACSPAPTDRSLSSKASESFRPLALGRSTQGTLRRDEEAQRTYLAVPARLAAKARATTDDRSFSKTNWSYSVKQKGRVQVYIVQTPDWFEIVEQELPRYQKDFNQLEEAIAFANDRYADWELVSLEP